MNILLDKCLDRRLARDLPRHNVKTVQEMGWAGIRNGKLLALAQSQFEVFVTGRAFAPLPLCAGACQPSA